MDFLGPVSETPVGLVDRSGSLKAKCPSWVLT